MQSSDIDYSEYNSLDHMPVALSIDYIKEFYSVAITELLQFDQFYECQ